jgi:hypothetical protein
MRGPLLRCDVPWVMHWWHVTSHYYRGNDCLHSAISLPTGERFTASSQEDPTSYYHASRVHHESARANTAQRETIRRGLRSPARKDSCSSVTLETQSLPGHGLTDVVRVRCKY